MIFRVVPTEGNLQHDMVEGALVPCWVVEDSLDAAYNKASFYVAKYDWVVEEIEDGPIAVKREDFLERDSDLEQYDKAQENGIAVEFVGWSRDGKTTSGPIKLEPAYRMNIESYLATIKKQKNRGRCLHFDSDEGCKEIVKAHSIQKQGALSAIAVDGHVYRITADHGTLKKNKGKLSCNKVGINRVSTFRGFCEKHDNELFERIDNEPLSPTDEQVFLYAYRSLCRELFVKEYSLNAYESQLNHGPKQGAIHELLSGSKQGTAFGAENVRRHKSRYDESFRKRHYQNIRYVLFESPQKPCIAFSGLIFPDFDFMGRPLQDLADHGTELELITYCSAPMTAGWGFLFAWHVSNSQVCVEFMRSLATMMCEGRKATDMLFRLVISGCENHAFSPSWWEELSGTHQEQIIERASKMSDNFVPTPHSYLMEGLEGIASWQFDKVNSCMETETDDSTGEPGG